MAIRKEGGHYKSERTDEEDAERLMEEMKSVDPDVLDAVAHIMSMEDDERNDILGMSDDLVYEREPPSIEEFLFDEYYLGTVGKDMYSSWVEDFKELFRSDYDEVILSGAIGVGKDFFSQCAMLYLITNLWCLRSPQESYGMSEGDHIHLACVSIKKDLARRVVFDGLYGKVEKSPFFMNEVKPQKRKDELDFGKGILMVGAESSASDILGMDIFAAIIDEANFFGSKKTGPGEEVDEAEEIYNAIKRRMTSRFQVGSSVPGTLFVLSSKQTSNDFVTRLIEQSENDPGVMVRDYALWEANPEDFNMDDTFEVLVGNEVVESRIIEEGEELSFEPDEREGVYLIDVPEDLRGKFERDLTGAIRDIAGISTVALRPLIRNPEKIAEMRDDRPRPFDPEVWVCGEEGGFKPEVFTVDHGGVRAPKLNPNAERHVHIDLSISDKPTGICVSHIAGHKRIARRGGFNEDSQYDEEQSDGSEVEELPIYVVDFILRVRPPTGGEINFGIIRGLIYKLMDLGFPISYLSMDQFQSAGMLQQFEERGIETAQESTVSQIDPFIVMKRALYENRVKCYHYPPLEKELRELEFNEESGKVECPDDGLKDLSDAFAACLYSFDKESREGFSGIMVEKSDSEFGGGQWAELSSNGDMPPEYAGQDEPTVDDYNDETDGVSDLVMPMMG